MNTSSCTQLDDYLGGWLSETERNAFEVHLANCRQCRQSVEQQRHIDDLLARGMERLEPAPPYLVSAVETRIQSLRRRRARQLAWGVPTGIALAFVIGTWASNRHTAPPAASRVQREVVALPSKTSAKQESRADQPVQVTLSDPTAAILVPMNKDAPTVSIVWVYPAIRPSRQSSGEDVQQH